MHLLAMDIVVQDSLFHSHIYIYIIVLTGLVKNHGTFFSFFFFFKSFSVAFLLVSLYQGPIDREVLFLSAFDHIIFRGIIDVFFCCFFFFGEGG